MRIVLFGRAWVFVMFTLFAWVGNAHAQKMRVHFIDVGQGAATLLEFQCAAILVDTGSEQNGEFEGTEAIMDYLESFFAARPDLNNTLRSLILTHAHIDHTRGVKAILAKYSVLNGVTNGFEKGSGKFGQIALHKKAIAAEHARDSFGFRAVWMRDVIPGVGLTDGAIDPVKCDDADPKITALWGRVHEEYGWKAKQIDNGNNHSVVLRVDFGKSSMLISGDLEADAIPDLLALHKSTALLDVDVYHVGHHGAANGTTEPMLRAMTPKMAVIAMGPADRRESMSAWKHGHPRKVTVELLAKHIKTTRPATKVLVATGQSTFETFPLTRANYSTGWDGTVVLEADVDGTWGHSGGAQKPSQIDLNVATVAELITLPMIGPARARAIVEYRGQVSRDSRRPFASVDDLIDVTGLGKGTISAIRHLVTVKP